MVAKMIRWRPWPPILSKKFRVRLVIGRIEGAAAPARLTAELKWKGPRAALRSLRRTVKRNCTREEDLTEGGVVEWNEEFESVCSLTGHRENSFHPWDVEIVVFNGLNQGPKNKATVIGTTLLNLAEFASTAEEAMEINLSLLPPGVTAESHPSLHVTLSLLELRTFQESPETITPALSSPPSDPLPSEKDEFSALKAGLRKVKILTDFVSTRKARRTPRDDECSEGRCSVTSDDQENIYPFDTDSDDYKKRDPTVRKSFSYGTLASIGGSFYSGARIEDEDWVYYSHRRSDVGSLAEAPIPENPKRSILPWKRRKFNLKSPKAKGEPLLKKDYGEEGGDDIDYDRRQLSSSDESPLSVEGHNDRPSVSEFGEDGFEVGLWEQKEVVSRDGRMKLSTQVFFASIDQRSERAAGESACTALVAVIADWFQSNRDSMPIKSQLDSLIRDGSLEWRNLCEKGEYMARFPDKHFDLDTVLQAKIRPLSVVPGNSFVGFFHPEGFDFLQGAMSFDAIWEEIGRSDDPRIYIVSWNDHFFVLKVDIDAYYIIDTLGERLSEGCSQAYVLKFDDGTVIHKISSEADEEEEVVCSRGKESCKEYIKSFMAAIPIRELQDDIKKGLMPSTPLHQRLQIEFHYTETAKDAAFNLIPSVEVV